MRGLVSARSLHRLWFHVNGVSVANASRGSQRVAMVVESFLATFATKSRTSNGRECWNMLVREAVATSWDI